MRGRAPGGQHLGFQGRAGTEPIPAPVPSSPWHGCCALVTLTPPAPRAWHSPSSSFQDPITFLPQSRDNGVPEQGSSFPSRDHYPWIFRASAGASLYQMFCAARGGGGWELRMPGRGSRVDLGSGFQARARITAQVTQCRQCHSPGGDIPARSERGGHRTVPRAS